MWQTKFGKCIYSSFSGYKVYQNFFYRWLTLDSDALQTVINKRHPERPILHYLSALSLMARKFPGPTCLLGIGGAGLLHMLAVTTSSSKITAIDKSEEVIQIAKKFFMLDEIPHLDLVTENALDFIQADNTSFTHLLIDLFNAHEFPQECNNESFFIHCKNKLTSDGFMAINLANQHEQWPIFQFIQKQFKNTLVIPMKKSANVIIIGAKHDNEELFLEQIQKTKEIKNVRTIEYWGYVADIR